MSVNSLCEPDPGLPIFVTYVCALYDMPKLSSVDDARFASFQHKYVHKKGTRPLEKIKGINPSSMPPCGTVLANKIQRINYVAHLWKRARLPVGCILKAEDHGWKLNGSSYSMNWYDGEQPPQNVADIIAEDDQTVTRTHKCKLIHMNEHKWTIYSCMTNVHEAYLENGRYNSDQASY